MGVSTVSDPRVSVVVPTYNRATLVRDAVDSVLEQTVDDLEVVVVDDCSTDDTRAAIESIDDTRVRYVRHEENRGGGAARNTGIEAAAGEYVAFLDSDDRWLPSKLEKQLELLRSAEEATRIAYCRAYFRYADRGILAVDEFSPTEGDVRSDLLGGWMHVDTSTLLVHDDCFEDVGGFDEELPSFQEYDLLVRLTDRYDVAFLDEPLVVERYGGFERISTDFERRIEGLDRFVAKHRADIEAAGDGSVREFYAERACAAYRLRFVDELASGAYLRAMRTLPTYVRYADRAYEPLVVGAATLVYGTESIPRLRYLKHVL